MRDRTLHRARLVGMTLDENGPTDETPVQRRTRLRRQRDAVKHRWGEVTQYFGLQSEFVTSLKIVPTREQLHAIYPEADREVAFKLYSAFRRMQLRVQMFEPILCESCVRCSIDDGDGAIKQRWGTPQRAYASHSYAWFCDCHPPSLKRRVAPNSHTNLHEALVCKHCTNQIRANTSAPPLFSRENGFYFSTDSPQYKEHDPFEALTLEEQIVIARICPIMHCESIKHGNRRLKGHVACVEHSITAISTVLPRLGPECCWIVFNTGQRDNITTLKVRKHVVEKWLRYFVRYSMAYKGVEIDMDRIPDNGVITGVRVVLSDDDGNSELLGAVADEGPAPGQMVIDPNATTYSAMCTRAGSADAVAAASASAALVVGIRTAAIATGAAPVPVARSSGSSALRPLSQSHSTPQPGNVDDGRVLIPVGAALRTTTYVVGTLSGNRPLALLFPGTTTAQQWVCCRTQRTLEEIATGAYTDAFRTATPGFRVRRTQSLELLLNNVFRGAGCDSRWTETHGAASRGISISNHPTKLAQEDFFKDFPGADGPQRLQAALVNIRSAISTTAPGSGCRTYFDHPGSGSAMPGWSFELMLFLHAMHAQESIAFDPPLPRRRDANVDAMVLLDDDEEEEEASSIDSDSEIDGMEVEEPDDATTHQMPFEPHVREKYVDMQKTPYALGQFVPWIFLPDRSSPVPGEGGLCEVFSCYTIKSNRGKQPTYAQFVDWVFSAGNGAVAKHPTLRFVLLNILRRSQAMGQARHSLKTGADSRSMSVAELQAQIERGDLSLFHKIQTHVAGVKGTPEYWSKQRAAASSFVRELYYNEQNTAYAFHTGSCAEYHTRSLHRLLQRVCTLEARSPAEKRAAEILLGDSPEATKALHAALNTHAHIVTTWFTMRTELWFNIVLREGLGITDYWVRYEFAKSRGAIHFHALVWAAELAPEMGAYLNAAARCYDADTLEAALTEAAVQLDVFAKRFTGTASHPAGLVNGDPAAANTAWHAYEVEQRGGSPAGNFAWWPGPEGTLRKPNINALRATLSHYHPHEYRTDLVHLVNRILLHSCSAYCQLVARKKESATATATAAPLARASGGPHAACTPTSCNVIKGECRVGMGKPACPVAHPFTTKTRTYGQVPTTRPALVELGNNVLKLKQPRDHPRMVQGLLALLQLFRANTDFQFILCAAAVPTIHELVHELPPDEQDAARTKLNDLRTAHQWMDPEVVMGRVVDYIVAYATKNSATSGEMKWMFKNLATTADGTTSMASFAAKFVCGVLKKLEVTSQEASHQLAGNKLVWASRRTKAVSLGGRRAIICRGALSDASDSITRDNEWDQYKKRPAADIECFDTFVRARLARAESVTERYPSNGEEHSSYSVEWIVRYTGLPMHPTVPLNPDYCMGVLMRYRPNVRSRTDAVAPFVANEDDSDTPTPRGSASDAEISSSAEDEEDDCVPVHVPNENRPAVVAFKAFVQRPECPERIKVEFRRAVERAASKVTLAPAGGARVTQSPTPLDESDLSPDEVLYNRVLNSAVADPAAAIPMLNVGDATTDFHSAGTPDGVAWDPSFRTALDSAVDAFKASHGSVLELSSTSPVWALENDEQRFVLSIVLLHLKHHLNSEATDPAGISDVLRLVVLGIAGTGKSFLIRTITDLVAMLTQAPNACQTLAPSGVAACNANGSTGQRQLSYNSNSRYEGISQKRKAELQKIGDEKIAQLIDEISLVGTGQFAMICHRLNELQARGACADEDNPAYDPKAAGNIPLLVAFGDLMQIDAVLDAPLYTHADVRGAGTDDEKEKLLAYGRICWKSLSQNVCELTEPVRQQAGSQLSDELHRLRCEDGEPKPEVVLRSLTYWNKRVVSMMDSAERKRFENLQSTVVHAFSSNAKVDEANVDYLASFLLVLSVCQGAAGAHATAHANPRVGMAKAIPLRLNVAVGALVKMTLNMLAEHGLYNGSRGTVIGWDYVIGETPHRNELPKVVVVDFPSYTGPPFYVQSRWVQLRCNVTTGAILTSIAETGTFQTVRPPTVEGRAANIPVESRTALAAVLAHMHSAGQESGVSHVFPIPTVGTCTAVHIEDSEAINLCMEIVYKAKANATATWVPVTSTERQCDNHCCTRTGFPLKIAHACTMHGLQGLEVGPNEAMTGLVVSMSGADESRNPGMRYVGKSRVKTIDCLGMDKAMTVDDYRRQYTGVCYTKRTAELRRLRMNKSAMRTAYAAYKFEGNAIGTKTAYVSLLRWLVRYCREKCTCLDTNEAMMTLQKCEAIEAALANVE